MNRFYQKHVYMSGTMHSKAVEMWWKICLALVGYQRLFFDYRCVVHSEFLPEGQTVNKEYYLSIMRRLREKIRRKRLGLWKENLWILHHDNAPSHKAIM